MEKRTQRGFTLYELLVTVLIVGVVLALGVPNLQAFRQNSRVTGAANDLHAALHLARSESSRAKTNITVCASADGSNCGGTWEQGFIVFPDMEPDLNRSGAAETILRAHGALDSSMTLAVENDATYFTYSSAGLGRPNVGGNTAVSRIVVCDERGNTTAAGGNSAARLLVATPLGRATVFRDTTIVGDALTAMGKTCP